MSRRRPIALLVFAIASFVIAACGQVTAPRREDTSDSSNTCRSTPTGSVGRDCDSIIH